MTADVTGVVSPSGAAEQQSRLLLVSNDADLSGPTLDFLVQQGMRVEAVRDGPRVLAIALEGSHDLMLLDAMTPQLNSFELLSRLRHSSQMPVIVLSSSLEPGDRIAALEAGADDYLSKPFCLYELVARIRSLLRRTGWRQSRRRESLEVNGLRIDRGSREVWLSGQRIDLTSIEYELLELLVRSAGRTVTRDELMGVLFQREYSPYDRSIDVHISHLRKKLGGDRSLIRTVRSTGYFFCVPSEALETK